MYNPIEEKRRFVEAQIQKSFDSGINVADEIELEKAHKDGDHHPTKPWVWVSSANGGKGDWRVEGGRAHKKAGASTTDAGTGNKVDISKIPNAEFKRITQMLEKKNPDHRDAERYLEEEAMSDKELKNFYAVAEHFKNSGNINKLTQEYCSKWAELAKQEIQSRNKKSKTTPAPRKPGSTDEIERMTAQNVRSSILGLNNIGTNVKDKGDHFLIEFDHNDFTTNGQRSPQIDRIAKFLESMGASCVIGNNSIKAYKKVEVKKDSPATKKRYNLNPDGTPIDMSKIEDANLRFSIALVKTNIKNLKNKLGQTSNGAVVTRKNLNAQIEDQEGKLAEMEEEMNKRVNSKSTSKTQSPQDKVKDIMQQFDDTTMDEDEFDEYVDSVLGNDMGQKLRKEILNGNKSLSDKRQAYEDAVERHLGLKPQKYSEMDAKQLKAEVVGKTLRRESKQYGIQEYNIIGVGTSKDKIGHVSVNLKCVDKFGKKTEFGQYLLDDKDHGNQKFSIIDDDKKVEAKKDSPALKTDYKSSDVFQVGKQSKKLDKRDKIAQDAGFKDYEEMKGYQDYVTQKNLLKKRSTSSGMRLLYQKEIDKYEKNHADLIKRIGSNNT